MSFDISCLLLLDQDHINSTDSSISLSSSKLLIPAPISNENVRHPIKPRTMSHIPIPIRQMNDESSSLLNISLDISSDGDITLVQKRKILKIYDVHIC